MLMLNDYLPLQPLGNGATGIVFLAKLCSRNTKDGSPQQQQQQQQRLFAVKAFRKSRAPDLQRSHNEEQVLSKLHHAFLPHLHSAFEEGEFRFLVLDYCPGGDLNSLRHSLPDKRFSSAAIRFYAAEVVLALEHLHQEGVVYRDLKPENILLSSNGHVMLTDFDLSAALPPKNPPSSLPLPDQQPRPEQEEDSITSFTCLGGACSGGAGIHQRRRLHTKRPLDSHRVMPAGSVDLQELVGPTSTARSHSFVGTEEYVAPEIILGTGHEFAVDWWALGVLLYEMAYGTTPFRGLTAKETFHNILHKEARFPGTGATNPLQDLIRKLLVKEPHRRLGYCCSAAEIKAHPFFASLQWEALEDVLRPPFIPTEPEVDFPGFDLKAHLVEVECARAEARANRKLQLARKQLPHT